MRRTFVNILFLAIALVAGSSEGMAQSYPSRHIHVVVPAAPGGQIDILARLIGQKLSESVGQPVVIDNKPGGSGLIGTDTVAKAAPDGYTLLMAYPSHAINPSLFAKLPFDTVKDFAPITLVAGVNLVLLTNPAVPAANLKELIELAKAKPGTLNSGSVSGSLGYIAGEVFRTMAGINIVQISYRSVPQIAAALQGNEIQLFFDTTITAIPQVKGGRLKALAVTGSKRSPALPDVPTIAEAGVPGYELSGWNGLLAPAATPRAIVLRLNTEVARILKQLDIRDRLATFDIEPVGNSPEEFGAIIQADMIKWGKVVRDAGVILQ